MKAQHRHSATMRIGIGAALLLLALPAMAQWTGKGEAGLAIASGNSDSRTANARVSTTYKQDAWEHSLGLGGLYVRTEGETTARRWESMAQTRFDFLPNTFWYGGVRYEEDRFSGFEHQGLVTTGVGRRFIDNDTTKLLGQAGIGYKFSREVDQVGIDDGYKHNELAGVASLEFSHVLTATTSVFGKFGGEVTSGNNFLQNEVGVAVKMTDRMALAVAYAVRHNTDPPEGFEKTDTLATVNLVYEVR
jgi:putative salt-induced outer membrane protein